jgi:medium-chain acyl-[acyl-carrier-protein] hydrolase
MNSWIAHRKPNPEAVLRLFCFPYAGGGASVYKTWADHLAPSVDVCPIQLPGREGRRGEPPFTRLLPLVGAISETILPLLDRPFAFFGHSLGAKVAFELARALQRSHRLNLAHLFISACPAPQLLKGETIYDLPEDEFIAKLRILNDGPDSICDRPRALKTLLPCIRADFEVYDTYTYSPGPLLRCPITVLGGDKDPAVSLQQLSRWRDLTTSRFNLRVLGGDHFFLRTVQPVILEILSNELNGVLRPSAPSSCERAHSKSV